ncbi:MAG TPA: hypothetical protein VMI56_18020 [Reyranella sp.]|nr:hypothetical protein [Reyranella sp.]
MPIRYNIDHSEGLVEVFLDGEISAKEATDFFDLLETEKAVPYRKLIDATNTPAKIDNDILAIVGTRMARNQSLAAFAVVVPASGPLDGLARLFLLIVEAVSSRAQVFRSIEEARQWLAARK